MHIQLLNSAIRHHLVAGILIAAGLFFANCHHCDTVFHYTTPPDTGDGLETASLTAVGIDTALIVDAVQHIICQDFNKVDAMLIFKDERLVLETYFPGRYYQWDAPDYLGASVQWDRNTPHPIMSCTKSVASACIGIALDKGWISSVRASIFDYLPDHQQFRNGGKEHITIEHLLTMTSGLAWDEWGAMHGTSANDIDRIYFECGQDPVACVLGRDLVHPPGEVFTYNGGGIVVLGEILRHATRMDINAFAKQYLFGPLGVDSLAWYQHPNGVYATDGSLSITPRDMLKFGILYLHNGRWDNLQILPREWINKSAHPYKHNTEIKVPIEDSGKNAYGYTWWISALPFKGGTTPMYRANGWGGQVIMVFPDLNMVVVFTGSNYAERSKLFKIVRKYVLPAIE